MDTHEARGTDFLSGWERYPKNFSPNFAQVDLDACHQRLGKDAKRLFSNATTEITFQTVLPRPQDEAGEGVEILTDVATDDRMLDDILIVRVPRYRNKPDDTDISLETLGCDGGSFHVSILALSSMRRLDPHPWLSAKCKSRFAIPSYSFILAIYYVTLCS